MIDSGMLPPQVWSSRLSPNIFLHSAVLGFTVLGMFRRFLVCCLFFFTVVGMFRRFPFFVPGLFMFAGGFKPTASLFASPQGL